MKKVLVIEDDEKIREVLGFALMEEGYEVLYAENGESGLESARSAKPDLILLDIVLPGMDGFEVCSALKSDEEYKSIPILMMTGMADTEKTVKGLSAGADDYVTKPFNIKELLARVQSHLRTKELYDIVKIEEEEKSALLDVSQSLSSTSGPRETLYIIVSKIAEIIQVKRCSIIYVNPVNKKAFVMASHDAKEMKHIELNLDKYPEIQKVMETGESVIINDVYHDPILFSVRDVLDLIDIRSIMAFPVSFKDNIIGTLVLRTSRREVPFNEREIKFCDVISHLAAAPLKNAYHVEILQFEKEQERGKRLLAEERFKASRDLLELILKTSPVSTCVFDMEGGITNVNDAYLKEWTKGMIKEDVMGLNILKDPRDHDTLDFFEKILQGESLSVELVSTSPSDGEKRTHIFQGAPMLGFRKETLGGIFTTTDITERKRAHESMKLMALFPELNPAPVLRFDKDGVILMANPAAVEILRMERTAGVSLKTILPDMKESDFSKCIRNDLVLFHSAQIDTNFFQFTIRGSSAMGVAQAYGSNITQRKLAEEKQGRLLGELGEKVEELEKFRRLTIGREERIIELKDKVKELEEKLGEMERIEN